MKVVKQATNVEEERELNLKKTVNIIDEVLQRNMEMKELAEVEEARDKTFDEFLTNYLDHINGKVDP